MIDPLKARVSPIIVAPLPGEAFDSWLDAFSARIDTPILHMAPALGLSRPAALSSRHDRDSGQWVIAMQIVSMGHPVSEFASKLFAGNNYRDYLEVHGLSVQLTEALAEYWHHRVRSELVLPTGSRCRRTIRLTWPVFWRTDYRGCRYSFGYPVAVRHFDSPALSITAEKASLSGNRSDRTHD